MAIPTALEGDCLAERYELQAPAGKGSMGEVWRALDLGPHPHTPDGRVAVKILKPELAEDPGFVERFAREAQTMERIDHPNVVKVFDFGEDDGYHFLVMEYLDGRSGKELIEESAPVEAEVAANLIAQMCDGLQCVHESEVVHRDIKPGNVMIVGDLYALDSVTAKITDFGIARGAEDSTMTAYGAVIGTLAYMAPERVRGEEGTVASDVYSVGVVLYELLTKARPYEGRSREELAAAQRHRPTPPHRLHPGIPRGLSDAIMRALESQPRNRFADATTLGQAVQAGGRGENITEYLPPSRRDETEATLFRWRPRTAKPGRPEDDEWNLFRTITVAALMLVGLFVWIRLIFYVSVLSPTALVFAAAIVLAGALIARSPTGRRRVATAATSVWSTVRPAGNDLDRLQAREAAWARIRGAFREIVGVLILVGLVGYWAILTSYVAGATNDAIERMPPVEHWPMKAGAAVAWILLGLVPLKLIASKRTRLVRTVVVGVIAALAWTIAADLLPSAPSALGPKLWPDARNSLARQVSIEADTWASLLDGAVSGNAASARRLSRSVERSAQGRIEALDEPAGSAALRRAQRHTHRWLARMRHARERLRSPACRQGSPRVGIGTWGARVACG